MQWLQLRGLAAADGAFRQRAPVQKLNVAGNAQTGTIAETEWQGGEVARQAGKSRAESCEPKRIKWRSSSHGVGQHRYFFFGTFAPFLRASERPIATACLRLVTFFPLRPLFSVPRFISCISFFTCLPAAEPYFLLEDFLAPFLELDFFALFFVAIE
jgi:hypothetical protein